MRLLHMAKNLDNQTNRAMDKYWKNPAFHQQTHDTFIVYILNLLHHRGGYMKYLTLVGPGWP